MAIKKELLKCFTIVPILFFVNLYTLFSKSDLSISATHWLLSSLFELNTIGEVKEYKFVIFKLFYILVFCLLYGNFIYKEFTIRSIYLFLRLKNRKLWFCKKYIELIIISATYTFVYLYTLLIIYRISFSIIDIENNFLIVFIQLWISITIFLVLITLLINIIALKYNSIISFMIVYICFLILIGVAIKTDTIPLFIKNPYLGILNPAGTMIIVADNMGYIFKIIYLILLNMITFYFGCKIVLKTDIGLINGENF